MSTSLQSKIQDLAEEFANSILEAIVSSPLEEVLGSGGAGKKLAPTGGGGSKPAKRASSGRLARRSDEDIAGVVEGIVALLKDAPEGLRAEDIREALSLEAKELPRPIAEALRQKLISKSGNKRATTYTLRAGVKVKKVAKKKLASSKKASKPAKKKTGGSVKKKAPKSSSPDISEAAPSE
jgi:hypothetical protein